MDHNSTCESLSKQIDAIERWFNDQRIYPRDLPNLYVDKAPLALVAKCISVARAVCCLVRDGFHAEAFGLTRTQVEIAFACRYFACGDSVQRTREYVEYFGKDRETWTKMMQKHHPDLTPVFSADHNQLLSLGKNYRNPSRWAAKTLAEMSRETNAIDVHDGTPLTWEYHYDMIYRWTSHYVHATVVALNAKVWPEASPFEIRKSAEENLGRMALYNAYAFLVYSSEFTCRVLGIDFPNEYVRGVETLVETAAH